MHCLSLLDAHGWGNIEFLSKHFLTQKETIYPNIFSFSFAF